MQKYGIKHDEDNRVVLQFLEFNAIGHAEMEHARHGLATYVVAKNAKLHYMRSPDILSAAAAAAAATAAAVAAADTHIEIESAGDTCVNLNT